MENKFDLDGTNSLIIMLGREVSHLAGVERINKDRKWYGYDYNASLFSDKAKINDILKIISRDCNSELLPLIQQFQKKFKDRVFIYDLAGYELPSKYDIEYSSIVDLKSDYKSQKKDVVQLKCNFDGLVEQMYKSDNLLYIGELDESFDIKKYLNEFSNIVIVTDDEFKQEEGCKVINQLNKHSVTLALKEFSLCLNKRYNSYKYPYGWDRTKNIIKELNSIKDIPNVCNTKIVENAIKAYPFLKKLNPSIIESFWKLYQSHTSRLYTENKVFKEDYFLDMFLVYAIYNNIWKQRYRLASSRTKISLTRAFCEHNLRDVERFRQSVMLDDEELNKMQETNRARQGTYTPFVASRFKTDEMLYEYLTKQGYITTNNINKRFIKNKLHIRDKSFVDFYSKFNGKTLGKLIPIEEMKLIKDYVLIYIEDNIHSYYHIKTKTVINTNIADANNIKNEDLNDGVYLYRVDSFSKWLRDYLFVV